MKRSLQVAALALSVMVLGASAAAAQTTHTVAPGDTLFKISTELEGTSWRELAELNADRIDDPDLIYVGQVLRLTAPDDAGSADQASAPADEPSAESASAPTPSDGAVPVSTWEALAQCESTGNWSINTGNGFYGGLQFTLQSWEAVGGSGYPHEASKAEQISRAEQLLAIQGWGAWPACSSELGLR